MFNTNALLQTGEQAIANLSGPIVNQLAASGGDLGVLRPFVHDGRAYISLKSGKLDEKGQPLYVNREVPLTNASLRKDEWELLDTTLVTAARQRLVVSNLMRSKGLVFSLDGMRTTVLQHETVSDFGPAAQSMEPVANQDKDRPNFEISNLPLPVTHKDFSYGARALGTSRNIGQPLDVTSAELAARSVAESVENLWVGSSTYVFGGGTLYGFLNHPNRNTYSLTAHWNDSAATGETILADVLAMKQALIDDRFYGPYHLFIPTNFETALDEDFKSGTDKPLRQRILEIEGIDGITTMDKLTADNVVLVQMTQDVVRLVEGAPMTTLQWETNGGLTLNFKAWTIMVPQLRSEQSDRMGLVTAT